MVDNEQEASKILHNGQIFIIRLPTAGGLFYLPHTTRLRDGYGTITHLPSSMLKDVYNYSYLSIYYKKPH